MVDITYRTLGPWGSGKGSNLHPAEVDHNFYSLAQTIVDLLNNPVPPNGIDSIQVSGTQMTITLTDGTVLGPFTLPVLTFRWRGEFEANVYAELDAFTVSHGNTEVLDPDTVSYGVYMVLIPGTYTLFDQNEQVGGEFAFKQLFGSTDNSLSTLGDVIVTDPIIDGDVLRWVAGADRWMNSYLGTMAMQNADSVLITGGLFHNLGNPVAPGDAVNKAYVDALPAGMTIDTGLMMANTSGMVGPAIGTSLSDYLDYALLATTRGTMLYRGGAGWIALPPGTAGLFLRTAGPGADPTWAVGSSGVTSVAAGAGITTGASAITSSGTVGLAAIADRNLLANASGASAAPTPYTLSGFLDIALSNARGSILTRTIGGWVALPPGSTGQYLKTQGAAADAMWDSPAGAGTVTAINAGTGISTGGAPITGSGTVSLAAVANNTMLANISGGSAAPAPSALSTVFDAILSATQGAVLYRSASAWSALAPGTAGQVLTTGGGSANPSWVNAASGAPIATLNMLANLSGGTGVASGQTVSAVLDAVFSSARGSVLFRGASTWQALAAGTAGQVLTTSGGSADPSWTTAAAGSLGGMVAGQIPIAASATTVTSSANLSGDVTSDAALATTIATNAVTTAKIAAGAVTYAKVQNVAASRLLGNPTGSAAPPSEITLGTNLTFSGSVLNAAGGSSGLSGMTAGQIPIAASATTVTSSGNLSGDVTSNASLVTTLATVNSNVGTFGGITVNAKGLVTAAVAVAGNEVVTTKTTTYTAQASDLGNTLVMAGSAPGLTLPAGIFTPGKTLGVSVISTVSCSVSNSTGLSLVGLTATSMQTGTSGTFVANADGTTLNFIPGTQVLTTSTLGAVKGIASVANNFLTGTLSTGAFTAAQPAFTNLSGTATIAQGGTGQTSAAAALTALGGLSTTAAASTYLPLTGGTITGALSVTSNSGLVIAPVSNYAVLTLDKPVATYGNQINGKSLGVVRWDLILGNNNAELGGDTGSDFLISRYNDAGAYISGALAIARSTGACSNISGSWVTISEGSLKQDVAPFAPGLDAVLALAPKTFRYRPGTPFASADAPSDALIGLLAEDVEPVLPEIISKMMAQVDGEEQEVRALNPGQLTYVLLNAVRELSTKVDALEQMLADDGR